MDKNEILETACGIEPSGAFFNIENSTIEKFVEDYFEAQKIDGLSAVKVKVKNEGKTNPCVAIYAFLNQSSAGIISDMNNIPPMLRGKIQNYNVRLSDEFKKVLYPLCGGEIESGKADGKEYFVRLNIFRVVGLMLSVDPSKHALIITDAQKLPKGNSVISVVKSEKYNYGSEDHTDKYSRQIDYLERRH